MFHQAYGIPEWIPCRRSRILTLRASASSYVFEISLQAIPEVSNASRTRSDARLTRSELASGRTSRQRPWMRRPLQRAISDVSGWRGGTQPLIRCYDNGPVTRSFLPPSYQHPSRPQRPGKGTDLGIDIINRVHDPIRALEPAFALRPLPP